MFHSEIFNLHKRLGIHFSLQIKLKSNINVKTHSVIYFVLVTMNTNQTYIFVYLDFVFQSAFFCHHLVMRKPLCCQTAI